MNDSFYLWRELDKATDRLVSRVFGESDGARGVAAGVCTFLLLFTTFKSFFATLFVGILVFLFGAMLGKERFRSGIRAARTFWLGMGLVRLVLVATVSPILYFTGGLDTWLSIFGSAIPAYLGLGGTLYFLPNISAMPVEEPEKAEMSAESPRTEYERLSREAAQIERRKRELEKHPDINRT